MRVQVGREPDHLMLFLDRKIGETIVVEHGGERLVVSLYRQRGRLFTLAFDGPQSFVISRGELLSPHVPGDRYGPS